MSKDGFIIVNKNDWRYILKNIPNSLLQGIGEVDTKFSTKYGNITLIVFNTLILQ